MTLPLTASLRPEAAGAPASGIVELAKYARTAGDVIQLWVGEGDMPTPSFIYEAATRSLAAGETTYTWQRGIPELRQAIATYASDLYGRELSPERFFVCGSGMQAIQIAMTMVAGGGDEVIIPSPTWPNAPAAAGLRGATPVFVELDHGNRGWQIDLEKLEAAITPRTKAMFINTPSWPLDHRRRDLHPLRLDRGVAAARALLPRRPRGRRPHHLGEHLLEELGDDRLAHRLGGDRPLAR
ncbi:MAG: class I and II aminotransferase [Xanthobacteraceae bacterium]|nr:MAG: class I and II aminotransferase [Xanthobacteraceae bacterium]